MAAARRRGGRAGQVVRALQCAARGPCSLARRPGCTAVSEGQEANSVARGLAPASQPLAQFDSDSAFHGLEFYVSARRRPHGPWQGLRGAWQRGSHRLCGFARGLRTRALAPREAGGT